MSATSTPPTIILATGNPHKVDELRAIFAEATSGAPTPPLAPRIIGLSDISGGPPTPFPEPAEIGNTFAENASIKAVSYAHQIARRMEQSTKTAAALARALVLADDSGIEIDALKLPDGTPRPGVISSHYSTDGRETGLGRAERDAANNARVLREMENVPADQRTARFVCCMCVVDLDGTVEHETRGTMEGRIGIPPRVPAGSNGFGYDPLFLVAAAPFNYTKTGAELTSAEKNALSHRGMAARAMVEWIHTSMNAK